MKAPKSWSEVTLDKYYNLCEAIEMDWSDDTDKAMAMLSALSGVSMRSLNEDVPVTKLKKAILDISFIGDDKPKGNPRPILWVGKRKFHVDLILRESTASSFISLTDMSKDKQVANTNIHNIMAIFCYEVNWFGWRKKRTASSQKEIAEYFRTNLTMDKALVYSGFFLRSYKGLLKGMQGYLVSKQTKIVKKLNKEIARNL